MTTIELILLGMLVVMALYVILPYIIMFCVVSVGIVCATLSRLLWND